MTGFLLGFLVFSSGVLVGGFVGVTFIVMLRQQDDFDGGFTKYYGTDMPLRNTYKTEDKQ